MPCPPECKTCPNNEYFDIFFNRNNLNCSSCKEGYKLVNNKCVFHCSTSYPRGCLTCDNDVENGCSTCYPNYFLNKTSKKCLPCGIDNCARCNENKECLECDIDYELENNKCIKSCQIGSGSKCKTCNTNNEHREECLSCNDGYFLPQDTNKKECIKCPEHCTNCYGETKKITCTSCESCSVLKEGKCNKIIFGDKEIVCALCNLDTCIECEEGQYMNDDEEKYCIPCGLNIKKCHKQNGLIIIDECKEGYNIYQGKCIKECEKGGLFKCLSCNTNPGNINECAECNNGFFIPSDSIDKERCYKCQEDGCITCSGTINNNICTLCHENYILFEGKCIKNCEIGRNEKCLSCNNIAGQNDRCASCNPGYYLPNYNSDFNRNLKCKKCPSDCKSCYNEGDDENPICTECKYAGYIIRKGNCIKGCGYLLNNNCLNCDDSGDFPICTQCKEGYYYPINNDKYYDRCIKCSMRGCKKCNNFDECLECSSEYSPMIINEKIQSCFKMCDIGRRNKCKSCSDVVGECGQCNDGFELTQGKCIIKDYDVVAEYETTEDNELVILMNSDSIEFIEVDGESIIHFSYIREIYIEKKGIHIIKFKLREYTSFAGLFNNNPYLKSIIFFDNFDSSWISYMNDCFTNCPNLEYADLSKLDLSNNHCFMNFFKNDKKLKEVHFPEKEIKNANYLYGMFQNCESLTSVDISSFSNDRANSVDSMFDGCTNLRSIKMGGLKNTIISNHRIIYNLPSSGNITLSKEYKTILEDAIPENWVVEVDDPNYKKTILIAGDSTADSTGGNNGETEGWGKYLGNYVSTEVNNLAFLGESARSFYRDGRWKNLIKKVVKGDYVFIQFGHFDGGDVNNNPKSALDGTGNETVTIKVNGVNETVHTFPWYIKYFANQVLVKGGTPVLLSLTPEFKFTDGKISESNKYQGYIKTVAEELKIAYIDLYSYIKKNYETLGEQYLKNNKWFPSDTIHTSPEAANFNAKMIITEIKCQKIEGLIDNINSEGNTIDYPCLDDI